MATSTSALRKGSKPSPCTKKQGCDATPSKDSFPRKAYDMIEKCDPSVACWSEEGDTFVVKDQDTFSKTYLPQYFNHAQFSSFLRQLNLYGFSKVCVKGSNEAMLFRNENFRRNRLDLLHLVIRSKTGDRNQRKIREEQELKDTITSLHIRIDAMARTVGLVFERMDRMSLQMEQMMKLMSGTTPAATATSTTAKFAPPQFSIVKKRKIDFMQSQDDSPNDQGELSKPIVPDPKRCYPENRQSLNHFHRGTLQGRRNGSFLKSGSPKCCSYGGSARAIQQERQSVQSESAGALSPDREEERSSATRCARDEHERYIESLMRDEIHDVLPQEQSFAPPFSAEDDDRIWTKMPPSKTLITDEQLLKSPVVASSVGKTPEPISESCRESCISWTSLVELQRLLLANPTGPAVDTSEVAKSVDDPATSQDILATGGADLGLVVDEENTCPAA